MPAHATRNTQHATRKLVPPLLAWFSTNARDLPWRRTRDPYAIWVSEIMLQQTQVKTVIPYWDRWLRELPTIQAAAKASPAKLHKLWEGLGYYTRVRNLQKAAQQIVAQHAGKFPKNFDDILALPGVGRYTAGAISSIAVDQPRPILDGNVIRVLIRIFGIGENARDKETNAQLWHLAEALVSHASRNTHHTSPCSHLNQSLMELGALICTPRSPQCGVCPVNKLCVAREKGLQEQLPNLGKRVKTTNRRFIAFVAEHNGKFLVRQRPTGVVNAHLWEFPNVEVSAEATPHDVTKSFFKTSPAKLEKLCVIKHSITRYRITLEAWQVHSASTVAGPSDVWLASPQLRRRAFTAAHKRILNAALAA